MELTTSIRLRRLQRVGHVMRMKDERVPKKVLKGYKEARRPVGPRGRWLDAVDRDGERMLKRRKWKRSAEDRCLEAEESRGKGPSWATAPYNNNNRRRRRRSSRVNANYPIIWATRNL
jgi:hypothetical protein